MDNIPSNHISRTAQWTHLHWHARVGATIKEIYVQLRGVNDNKNVFAARRDKDGRMDWNIAPMVFDNMNTFVNGNQREPKPFSPEI